MPDSSEQFPPPKGDAVDFSRWMPVANREAYIRGYFEFPGFGNATDSAGKRLRFFTTVGFLNSLVERRPLKNVAECGCFNGHSTYMIAALLNRRNFNGEFFVFDSFEGLSDPESADVTPMSPDLSGQELEAQFVPKKGRSRLFESDVERVGALMAPFPFVQLHKGWIPSQFHVAEDREFSFVHIDVDLYQPTLDSLSFFYPRLEKGGIISIDDYGLTSWPGCTRAFEEFTPFMGKDDVIFKVPMGGLIIIKS